MPSILFVCTANRFRSPLAAALFKKNLEERGITGSWQVGSAGTWTIPGKPVLQAASGAALRFGIDLSGHRSSEVSRGLLREYDLILVMQAGQKEALMTEFPELQPKIHLFSEVVEGRSYDIPDFLSSEQELEEVAQELNALIRRGLDSICTLAARLSTIRQIAELRDR
jgi:protein arginine phosphatase